MGNIILGVTLSWSLSSLFTYFVYRISTYYWDDDDVPISTPSGCIIGPRRVTGYAKPAVPDLTNSTLIAPISGRKCIWFQIDIYTLDSDSIPTIKFRHQSNNYILLTDQYDKIYVSPSFEEQYLTFTQSLTNDTQVKLLLKNFFEPSNTSAYSEPSHGVLYDNKFNLLRDIDNNKYFVSETIIEENELIFVSGYATLSENTSEIVLRESNKLDNYGSGLKQAISNNQELFNTAVSISTKVILHGPSRIMARFIANIAALGILATYLTQGDNPRIDNAIHLLAIPFFLILYNAPATLLRNIKTHKRFVQLKNSIHESRSGVYILQKRKHDLIPKLCDVLNELMKHESEILEKIVLLRTATDPKYINIVNFAESYPVLKSSENFLFFQNELRRTDTKIALTKSYTNDTILKMDNLRATVRGMFFSPFFTREEYFRE